MNALTDTSLRLRRLERRDLATLVEWMRDPALVRMILGDHAPSIWQFRAQILNMLTGGFGPAFAQTGHYMLDRDDGSPAGLAAFNRVNWRNRSAYYDLYLPDAAALRDAHAVTMAHGFDELNLHRVTTRVAASDTAAQSALLELGAQREVVLRGYLMVNDAPEDLYLFGMMRRDFPGERVP
jgi:RimJ/RimL family protein N-acetyltransferase